MPNAQKPRRQAEMLLVATLVVLAVAARWAGWREKTPDMEIFFSWYNHYRAAGLDQPIGNYNAPFAYLLVIAQHLPGLLILRLKAMFVAGDVVLAFYAYRIAALRRPATRVPTATALIVVLLPTVVLNASYLGQMDALWAAPAVAGVYYLLRDKPWWGAALAGVSLAIKPQAVFIFPLFLLLVLAGKIRWRTLLAAPAAYLLLDLPAVLSGRSPMELLTIYDLGRQEHNINQLTLGAPSIWTYIPAVHRIGSLRTLGMIMAAAVVVGVIYVLIARGLELTHERIVLAATLFSILLPFLLPGMHERYFFLADALTLLLAVYRPQLWFVAVLVEFSSLLSYLPYLFGGPSTHYLPRTIMSTMMLAALLTVGYTLLKEAFPPAPKTLEDELGELVSRPSERPAPLPARRA